MAVIIKTDGTMAHVAPKNGVDFSLEELQAMVGGFIEIVPIVNESYIVVNENGRLENLPHNCLASIFMRGQVNGDIVGDMLVCRQDEIK